VNCVNILKKWKKHLKRAAAKRAQTNISKYNAIEQSVEMTIIGAKQRCTNEANVAFDRYGGRGIEFRFDSIEHGIRWVAANLGTRPTAKHSIDRIDNDKHYEPGNLRWATTIEQARNKGAIEERRKVSACVN